MNLRPARHVSFQANPDGGVLLDTRHGTLYGLNPTGALIWATLADGGDLTDAITTILDRFDADEHQVRADVRDLVADLRAHALLEPAP